MKLAPRPLLVPYNSDNFWEGSAGVKVPTNHWKPDVPTKRQLFHYDYNNEHAITHTYTIRNKTKLWNEALTCGCEDAIMNSKSNGRALTAVASPSAVFAIYCNGAKHQRIETHAGTTEEIKEHGKGRQHEYHKRRWIREQHPIKKHTYVALPGLHGAR